MMMNCPDCGAVNYRRVHKCHACGETLPWPRHGQKFEQPEMHPVIAQRLTQLGFCRYPDETAEEFRERCRCYLLNRLKYNRDQAA